MVTTVGYIRDREQMNNKKNYNIYNMDDEDLKNLKKLEESFSNGYELYELDEEKSGIEHIVNADALWDSGKKCERGVLWKNSTQKYEINFLTNTRDLQRDVRTGKYVPTPPKEFELNERGRTRYIKSHTMRDRVLQKSLNDNVLLPAVTPKLIFDNGASQIGKGLSFARERFEFHMREAYKNYGESCICLVADFSKYFDNIVHSILMDQLSEILTPEELQLVAISLKEFEIDVSDMDDDEYSNCIDNLFNILEYEKPSKGLYDVAKYMAKSVGIGSQLSQIAGIFYPHEIDNYFKIVKSVKYYGRYMDDIYMFLPNKEIANEYKHILIDLATNLKIHLNEKKTRITPITSRISYLKINYEFKDNKLLRIVSMKTINREVNRLSKFFVLYEYGRMNLYDIVLCYRIWRFSYIKYDSKLKIHGMDNYILTKFPQIHRRYLTDRNIGKDIEWLKTQVQPLKPKR